MIPVGKRKKKKSLKNQNFVAYYVTEHHYFDSQLTQVNIIFVISKSINLKKY